MPELAPVTRATRVRVADSSATVTGPHPTSPIDVLTSAHISYRATPQDPERDISRVKPPVTRPSRRRAPPLRVRRTTGRRARHVDLPGDAEESRSSMPVSLPPEHRGQFASPPGDAL